ncbi:poly polymerase papa [Stylonychia lemnae]|uniref:polynucleotide adenylyltransferase n=1 Tax=Stylonychia lemnae TaxID=5949 RepID=A0A078AA56_STYLE|nr:poly polymerase papa [Stylonychia lemnae]|eukprot:CDW78766.1 poly polymerase papa [Stylonychia lemnae]
MDKTQQYQQKSEISDRQQLKKEFIHLLREHIQKLTDVEEYLILQYGSSFLGAETQESDYDLILVFKANDLQRIFKDSIDLRKDFFFNSLAQRLIDENKQSEETLQAVLISSRIRDIIIQAGVDVEIFKLILIYVKEWAQQRKIYGQQYGFLGGIAWAILVGNIMISYSQDDKVQALLQEPKLRNLNNQGMKIQKKIIKYLLLKFFKFYSKWEWPNPIIIDSHYDEYDQENQHMLSNFTQLKLNDKKLWNPISSVTDSQHLMPILTPKIKQIGKITNLSVNTAEQVLNSHLQIYQFEFKRAYNIVKKIYKGKLKLKDLKLEYDSFIRDQQLDPANGYQFAIQIDVLSKTEKREEESTALQVKYYHQKLFSSVESKLRSLIFQLDTTLNPENKFQCLIRPLRCCNEPELIENDQEYSRTLSSKIYIGLKQSSEDKELGIIDVSIPIECFCFKAQQIIDDLKFYLIKQEDMFDFQIKVNVLKR